MASIKNGETNETDQTSESVSDPAKQESTTPITCEDFCTSKPGLKYPNRVLYVLKRKYPNITKTFSDWDSVLKTENII